MHKPTGPIRIYNHPPTGYKRLNCANIAYIAALIFLLQIINSNPVYATDLDSSIIKEALAGLVCDKNIQVIVEGAYYQSSRENSASKKPERHFENANLKKSFAYIKSERRKILNAALFAGPEPEMRLRSLFHFGMLAHTVNSFYTNTNYVPNKINKIKKKFGAVDDPYGIDLVDWTETESKNFKYRWLAKGKRQASFDKKLGNTTVAKVARGLAIREIQRQWDYLESLIRVKYSNKANLIIAALKSASCDGLVPEELDGLPLHAREENQIIDADN